MTTPNITINVSELLNKEKLSEETNRLFRSVLGFNEPTVAEEGEKLTAESEPKEEEPTEYEEAVRILKLAESEAVKGMAHSAQVLVTIADRYIKLGGY